MSKTTISRPLRLPLRLDYYILSFEDLDFTEL